MEETQTNVTATVEVPSGAEGAHGGGMPPIINVSTELMGLTWVTFIIMTIILYKVAWKPILAALESREHRIRRALDDAESTRVALEAAEQSRREMIVSADRKSAEIIEHARAAAVESAAAIEARAKADAADIIESARREIVNETERARYELRREAASLAIDMAGKIMGQNMDSEKNRDIVKRTVGEPAKC